MNTKLRAQLARFARTFGFALAGQAATLGTGHITLELAGAAILAALETAWRQLAAPPDAKG